MRNQVPSTPVRNGPARVGRHVPRSGAPPVATTLPPAECRAGRALLSWSLHDLAALSGFPVTTLDDFEEGRRPLSLSAQVALQRVFRRALSKTDRSTDPRA